MLLVDIVTLVAKKDCSTKQLHLDSTKVHICCNTLSYGSWTIVNLPENIRSLLPSVFKHTAWVTMLTATNKWYFFRYSLVLYGDNDLKLWFHCTFRHVLRDLQYLKWILTWLVHVVLIWTLAWLAVKNYLQLQSFPIDTYTVRHVW